MQAGPGFPFRREEGSYACAGRNWGLDLGGIGSRVPTEPEAQV